MKFCKVLIFGLVFLSVGAHASVVSLNALSNLDSLNVGDSFTLNVAGSGFESDIGISGGAFKVQFDTSVVKLNSWNADTTVWNFLQGKNSLGDYYFTSSAFGSEPRGSFNIGTLIFQVLGTGNTTIALQPSTSDWGANDSRFPTGIYPQDQIQYGSVSVSAVPIPATFWLFGSGILALGRFVKRNKLA